MRVFRSLEEIPAGFGPSIVSVGNFDGVHQAHTRVLQQIAERALNNGATSVAVTFDPHPMRILRPGSELKLLTPTPAKLRLLEKANIDAVLLLPFTREVSLMSPNDFVKEILQKGLHAVEVHEGYNFHFGHKAAGNIDLLRKLGEQFGFKVIVYPELRLRTESVSSTRIRQLIQAGKVGRVRPLLGHPFSIRSTPASGRGYGARYTVPTINLGSYDELVPRNGVYITRTRVADECFDSVTNVGNRPTFGADSFAIESHLLNFHPIDLAPDTELELFFLKRLRDEMKFDSVEALRQQIGNDVRKAKHYFALLQRATEAVIDQ